MNNHEKCYRKNTFGYVVARKYFKWQFLDESQEWWIADRLVELADLIDESSRNTFGDNHYK